MNKDIIEYLSRDFSFNLLPLEKIKMIYTEEFEIPLGSSLVEKNPILKLEIWIDKLGNQIIKSDDSLITRKESETQIEYLPHIQHDILYGIVRTELTHLIRKELSKEAYFAIHAGLIKYKNEVIMIVGDKGTGKTSSCLLFLKQGAEIFTDELVFFTKDGIKVLSRMVSIDEINLVTYFPQFKKYIFNKSKSMLNLESKYVLNTKLKEVKEHNIDKIIILADKESTLNEELAYLKKKEILANQLVPTQLSNSEEAVILLEKLIDKIELSTILNINKGLNSE